MAKTAPGTTLPHGSPTRYDYHGCRCVVCLEAKRKKVYGCWQRLVEGLPDGHMGEYRLYAMGCRCESCREAKRVYVAELRADRVGGVLADGDPRHGTSNGFDNFGCRCGPCADAKRARSRNYYARTGPA